MDGFYFKGRELLVKAPLTLEERSAIKEIKEEIASGSTRPMQLRKNKPTVSQRSTV